MATRFSSTLHPDVSIAANFQALAQFVEDTLVATGGWSVTSDTGQTLPSALAVPTLANQKKGYRIYHMNDVLQPTFPVFMRIDYGSSGILTVLGMWLTIGAGSDGAGNITPIWFNGGASAAATVNGNNSGGGSTTQVTNSYGSADVNRCAVAMCVQAVSASYHLVFTLGRTKDALGNDTGSGLLLIYKSGFSQALDFSVYIMAGPGTQPFVENGLSYILGGQNPSQTFAPGDVGLGIIIHFAAIAKQPGTQILICNSNDVSTEGFIRVTLYNQPKTFIQLNVLSPKKAMAGGGTTTDGNARVLMRYD